MKTESQIHHNMSRIRGKDTKIELILRHALYHEGIRYRKNMKALPGCPDIVLTKYRIAIFCDGDFFHGYDLCQIQCNLKRNKDFWIDKIKKNQERDCRTDEELVQLGYHVLRFWEHEIRNDLSKVMDTIYTEIRIQGKENEG